MRRGQSEEDGRDKAKRRDDKKGEKRGKEEEWEKTYKVISQEEDKEKES